MLQDSCQSMLEVRTRDEFQSAIVKFAQNLGFDRVAAITVHDRWPGHTDFIAIHNAPAAYAQEGAARTLLPPEPKSDVPLTPLETEALRWTLEGKAAWELGAILSISEALAVSQANNAMHKLHCVTKLQAALKAQRMGLLRSS